MSLRSVWAAWTEWSDFGFSDFCNHFRVASPLWGVLIWFMDVVAGVAWIVIYFISLQIAFIDSTAQQCSSCPALNNNIAGLPPPPSFLLGLTDTASTKPCKTASMHDFGSVFPCSCCAHVLGTQSEQSYGSNVRGGGASIYLPQRVDQLLKAD